MSKKQEKYYVVMRSGFGDLWVGRMKDKPEKGRFFGNFDEAIERAKELNDSIPNEEELEDQIEEDCELLGKNMEKWIVE